MSDERLIRHVETGNDRGELTASFSWWDTFEELKGARLHGRDLFDQPTSLREELDAIEASDAEETEATTEVLIRMRVNTSSYARTEHIMGEIAQSLDWLAFDHSAILDAIWQEVPGDE